MEKKEYKSQYEKVTEITEKLEANVRELFDSDKYKTWLSTMSKFYNYSLNNTLLIAMQKPDATYVASYNAWRDKFGRNVKKGEHGIQIFAPCKYKAKILYSNNLQDNNLNSQIYKEFSNIGVQADSVIALMGTFYNHKKK